MSISRFSLAAALVCALVAAPRRSGATGVPVGGFLPFAGIGLTDEFNVELSFFAEPRDNPSGGILLGSGGVPHYDLALLDTGAAVSLVTQASDAAFGIGENQAGEADGFRGTGFLTIGGATGFLQASIGDPLGLYAGGLQARTANSPLAMPGSALKGQVNTSILTLPAESDLPNVLGLPYASQYATKIRNDLPQIFQYEGQTVRTPAIEFLELGTGNAQGIARRAPMPVNPGASFAQPPFYFPSFSGELDEFHEDPSQPTVIQGGLFLNVNVANGGGQISNSQFFFDTGADVTVVSELNALQLGFDVVLDEPEFTVAIVGSGGTTMNVPGFFVDQFTIQALGGSVVATNVPVIVLNVTNPADPGNVVPGIVGTNLLSGRNVVIDPDPSLGGGNIGPHLYISDPVTTSSNWSSGAASASWTVGNNWTGGLPGVLSIANVRHVGGGNQEAVLSSSVTAWEVNVSGASAAQQMKLRAGIGSTLTTFAGLNIEQHGVVELSGALLDVQFIDIRGGRLAGTGSIATGSGPIPGQVENIGGFVAPGNSGAGALNIEGRFSNGATGTVEIDLGGPTAIVQYDRIAVDGPVTLDGTLAVSLINLGGGLFAPSLGQTFSIITATEIGGEFAHLNLPSLAGNLAWFVGYEPTSVLLKVVRHGDFDGDADVDAADLAAWKAGFGQKYNGADFLAWQRNLGQSGLTAAAGAVPEPGALGLILAAACGWAVRRAVTLRCARS